MIQRDQEQLVSATIGQFSGVAQNSADMNWKNKLEAAQNVLFCKELFSQLARYIFHTRQYFHPFGCIAYPEIDPFFEFTLYWGL